MTGWLIVNGFLDSAKFDGIYAMLLRAAQKRPLRLELKTSSSLICESASRFSEYGLPDFVLFWDKDVYLARRLEEAGVPVFNSARAVEICDNKILTTLSAQGKVRIPRTVIAPKTFEGVNYRKKDFLQYVYDKFGFPFVLKEAYGSFGKQVYLVGSPAQAEALLDRLGYKEFLMQEFVSSSRGKDIRINVVGDEAVSSMLRYNPNDFRSNVTGGGQTIPHTATEEEKKLALDACRAVGADFAGVDVLLGPEGEPILCEINSNPHFESSYLCNGIDMSGYILDYILRKLR